MTRLQTHLLVMHPAVLIVVLLLLYIACDSSQQRYFRIPGSARDDVDELHADGKFQENLQQDEAGQDTSRLRRLLALDSFLPGGTGMAVGPTDNLLYLAQIQTNSIVKLDPETGQELERIQHAGFVDDLVVAVDGTIYWTDFIGGTIHERRPSAPEQTTKKSNSVALYHYGSLPAANAITLSEDGSQLFFGQCFKFFGKNGLFQRNLGTGETTQIGSHVKFCASNALQHRNGSLYVPRTLESRILRIDRLSSDNPTETEISRVVPFPSAVKFDSQGNLFALQGVSGNVYQIDLDNPDVETNGQIYATLPSATDNLAFDKDDRLYVVSLGHVWEVLNSTSVRVVVSPNSKK